MKQHQSHVSKEVLCCQGQKAVVTILGVTLVTSYMFYMARFMSFSIISRFLMSFLSSFVSV